MARMDAALITVGQGSLYHTTLASSPDGTSWRWLGHCVEVSAAEPASVTVVSLGPSPDGSLVCAGLSNGQGALMRVGQVRFAIPHLPVCDHCMWVHDMRWHACVSTTSSFVFSSFLISVPRACSAHPWMSCVGGGWAANAT